MKIMEKFPVYTNRQSLVSGNVKYGIRLISLSLKKAWPTNLGITVKQYLPVDTIPFTGTLWINRTALGALQYKLLWVSAVRHTFSVELISLCLQTPQILALVVHSQLDWQWGLQFKWIFQSNTSNKRRDTNTFQVALTWSSSILDR